MVAVAVMVVAAAVAAVAVHAAVVVGDGQGRQSHDRVCSVVVRKVRKGPSLGKAYPEAALMGLWMEAVRLAVKGLAGRSSLVTTVAVRPLVPRRVAADHGRRALAAPCHPPHREVRLRASCTRLTHSALDRQVAAKPPKRRFLGLVRMKAGPLLRR